jgi:hypothetical protein
LEFQLRVDNDDGRWYNGRPFLTLKGESLMVVTHREFEDFKRELNVVLEGIDKRLKALEEAKKPSKKAPKEVVDKAA